MTAAVTVQVDYTGFSTINAQRFGQKFVGKVANPHDILLWHKAPVRKAKVFASPDCYLCRKPYVMHHMPLLLLHNMSVYSAGSSWHDHSWQHLHAASHKCSLRWRLVVFA